MKRLRRIFERIVEAMLTLSGGITSLVILLIVLFLFKEGIGLFNSPDIEKGYVLCVNSSNQVRKLDPYQIKQIFDSEITNWKEVGGLDSEIMLFRFDEIFNMYSDEELGEDETLLPQK